MKNKKRLLFCGIFLGLLGLGVINASLYWDSGYVSKDVSFGEDSEDMIEEVFDIAAGNSILFDDFGYSKTDQYDTASSALPYRTQQTKNAVKDDFSSEESEPLFPSMVPASIGGGMTQQGGRSSQTMSADTSSNSGSYRGGYARHSKDNGIWNSLKPTRSANGGSSSDPDPGGRDDSGSNPDTEVNSIDEGGPTAVPDSGTTVWMLGLGLLLLSLFVTKYRSAKI